MRTYRLAVLIFFILPGCSEKRKINISSEYVTNEYWPLGISSFFTIEKQKIKKDSVLNTFLPASSFDEADYWNVADKLEIDTTYVFDYCCNPSSKIIDDTVFFNKRNKGKFYKLYRPFGLTQGKFESIGNLEKKTWYKFTNLRESYYHIYIFIDSIGRVHRFDQNLASF